MRWASRLAREDLGRGCWTCGKRYGPGVAAGRWRGEAPEGAPRANALWNAFPWTCLFPRTATPPPVPILNNMCCVLSLECFAVMVNCYTFLGRDVCKGEVLSEKVLGSRDSFAR